LAEGNYLSATVLADVTPEMRIFAEVISAPVACVTPFDTEEEAVTLARAIAPATAAYLWTSDRPRARRLAPAIGSAMTWVNSHNPRDLRTLPGWAADGPGSESSQGGIDFYTRSSDICVTADDGPTPRLGG
jgi:5-carboxymethyl-2-hydroxymuconic-semialdehyde dehydrogenase